MPPRKGSKRQPKKQQQPDALEQLKQQRLEILLGELDTAIKTFQNELQVRHKKEKERVENEHRILLTKTPEEIKNMRFVDFMKLGIPFTHQPAHQKIDSSTVLAKFMKKPEPKTKRSIGGGASSAKSKQKVLSSKRKSTVNKKFRLSVQRKSRVLPGTSRISRKGDISSGNESYVDVSDDEVFFTPSHKSTRLGPITPKFDMAKPLMRSQVRSAKPGEVAVSLSGSPLCFVDTDEKPTTKSVSHKTQVAIGKKVYHFSEPQPNGSRLRAKERKEILDLQRKLDQMLKN